MYCPKAINPPREAIIRRLLMEQIGGPSLLMYGKHAYRKIPDLAGIKLTLHFGWTTRAYITYNLTAFWHSFKKLMIYIFAIYMNLWVLLNPKLCNSNCVTHKSCIHWKSIFFANYNLIYLLTISFICIFLLKLLKGITHSLFCSWANPHWAAIRNAASSLHPHSAWRSKITKKVLSTLQS